MSVPTQEEFEDLNSQYLDYVEDLKSVWLNENRPQTRDVLEVMDKHQRYLVKDVILAWGRYIKPLADDWWRKRGFETIWPEKDSEPMKLKWVGI